MKMLAQFILVVVVSSVVHTRHLNVDSTVYGHAGDQFTENQNSRSDLNDFGQPEGYEQVRHTEHGQVVPKTNIHRPPNVKQVNSDSVYVVSERNQKLRINPAPAQGHDGIRNADPTPRVVNKATQYTKKHLENNEQVRKRVPLRENGSQQSNGSDSVGSGDNHAGQLDNVQSQGSIARNDNKKLDTVSQSKHEPRTYSTHGNAQNIRPNEPNEEIHSRHKDIDAPVTERKPFTNAPTTRATASYQNDTDSSEDMWVWSDKPERIPDTDLEDRAAFSGDGCPSGKAKIKGTDMCIQKH